MHWVSVVIPTYNNAATIERALNSASRALDVLWGRIRVFPARWW